MTAPTRPTGTRGQLRAILDGLPSSLRGEIVGGRLVVSPRPASPHLRAVSAIDRALGARFDDAAGAWWILPAPELSLAVDPDFDRVTPDLAGWRRAHLHHLPNTTAFAEVPDWVCEVVSPQSRADDRDAKLPFYARAGVSHAWLVEPEARTLEAFVREGDAFVACGVWRGEVRVRVPPFEAAEVDLARWWMR